MGRVYLGYSPAGRAVAVKVCHSELAADPSFVERFAREATAAQAVNGLYTAQVVGAGPYDRPPWMATAYVPGPPLSDYVHGYGPLPEPAAWRLAAGLAEALLAVHACGLVHRDLKPSNVLLATDGPRVIDFGIASALEVTGLTTTGSVMGSPPYMSPEQATGAATGPASDVFALGSTLAFAASGAAPFGDGDAHALLFRVVHMPPALDTVPERLRAVVAACLAKDPAARPTLPQLLHACRDGAAAGGNSAASFWPRQMTAVIAGYQSGSVSAAARNEAVPSGGPAQPGGTVPSGGTAWSGGQFSSESQFSSGGQRAPHPSTVAASVPTRRSPFGPAGTTVVSAIGRRRMLSGIGGLVVAGGLAAGGWKLASSDGSPAVAGATAGSVPGTRVAWKFPADAAVRTGVAVSDDGATVYVGTDKGTVYALDAASGRPSGVYRVGRAVSGVTMASGTLLVGSADGKVYAFQTGAVGFTWTSPAAGAAIAGAPVTAGGGVLYAGSEDGYVYAFDTGTGQRKWRAKTGTTAVPGPPDNTGVLYAAGRDGNFYVLDAASGKIVARYAAGAAITSAPLVILGGVYFGTGKGVLYDVSYEDLTSGAEMQWNFAADGAIAGTPATFGDVFFTATTRGTVYAVQPGSNIFNPPKPGTALWSYPVGGPVRSGPAYEGGLLYVGSDNGNLYAIDTSTHTVSWTYPTGGAIQSKIAVNQGRVYFGNLSNQVYALRA
jgi:serine/threonine protein kinase/outer membrane protein assembly factor BamB